MENLADFHPAIQYAIRRLFDPAVTFEKLGHEKCISKQAVEQQCKKALHYLRSYPARAKAEAPAPPMTAADCRECARRGSLIALLQQRLVIAGAQAQLLKLFREKVLKFMPRFKVVRLPAWEKKKLLDWREKFKKFGGQAKDFAAAIERSPETLSRWQEAYDKHGMAGLTDKITRPKNFGNKIPLWIKEHLILLFLQFPRWTPFQFHSYIRHNPATHWYVSIPSIQKLKAIHEVRSAQEKERIAKRWCFAAGTKAWTVDYTCLLKTEQFKLQCLTVSDQRSRFLIHTALYLNTSTDTVVKDLEELFVRFGKPDLIKADNGPEYRLDFREQLRAFSVHLLSSPKYYGQFNGAHERIHRTMKAFIDPFAEHQNITRLVDDIKAFQDQYNYKMPMDSLEGKTPSDIFFGDGTFTPSGAEIVTPYEKEGELRMKFTNRDGGPARMSVPTTPPET